MFTEVSTLFSDQLAISLRIRREKNVNFSLNHAIIISMKDRLLCIIFFFNFPSFFVFLRSHLFYAILPFSFYSFFIVIHTYIYVHATSIAFLFTLLFVRQLLLHFNVVVGCFFLHCWLSCICSRSHPIFAALTCSFILLPSSLLFLPFFHLPQLFRTLA